ncbi:hypothetical protein M514_15448 [Trichuris suis]|uniref:Uncharacterized protein n=1 Tax=Trichuris suis TaxID=68888 RepID=A0A085NRS9_9BILA|nr:hypothetical protein M514_15448 [Trichuris suis]
MANDASELWIILPLVICSVFIAIIAVLPVLIRRYCYHCFPEGYCDSCCRWMDTCVDSANYCVCSPCKCVTYEEDARTGIPVSTSRTWQRTTV